MTWSKEINIRDAGHWLARKIELIELKHQQITKGKSPRILRGGIFTVELGEGNIGGEKNKERPCLIISNNNLNIGDTVVILPLTTKFPYRNINGTKQPRYKNHYILYKATYPFLDNDSCIKCEDIRTIDKVRIKNHLGNIPPNHLSKLIHAVKFTLGF